VALQTRLQEQGGEKKKGTCTSSFEGSREHFPKPFRRKNQENFAGVETVKSKGKSFPEKASPDVRREKERRCGSSGGRKNSAPEAGGKTIENKRKKRVAGTKKSSL